MRLLGLRAGAIGWAALVVLLAAGGTVRAVNCPPETLDYGPSYGGEVERIVLDHQGTTGPVLPDPQDCARTERDLGLLRAAFPELANLTHAVGVIDRNFISIQTDAPSDPELVCTNLYYQVAFNHWYGNWWGVTFPRDVNVYAMIAIYEKLAAVSSASLNIGFCQVCCGYAGWGYSERTQGVWHWTVYIRQRFGPFGSGCRDIRHEYYVSQSGQVWQFDSLQWIEAELESEVSSAEGGESGAGIEADGVSGAADGRSMATGAGSSAEGEPGAAPARSSAERPNASEENGS